jgi:hypothetical protein
MRQLVSCNHAHKHTACRRSLSLDFMASFTPSLTVLRSTPSQMLTPEDEEQQDTGTLTPCNENKKPS